MDSSPPPSTQYDKWTYQELKKISESPLIVRPVQTIAFGVLLALMIPGLVALVGAVVLGVIGRAVAP